MKETTFIDKCQRRGLNLSATQIKQFALYAKELLDYNQKVNLTAILDIDGVYQKHFYDSLLFSFYYPLNGTLVDIGTGAGFPGLVLKIAYPSLKVTLVEASKKRCNFLHYIINLLKLEDVSIINQRAEDFSLTMREKYDYVTARAVAPLPILLELSAALIRVNGYFLAYRGFKGEEEIAFSEKASSKLNLKLINIYKEKLEDATRILALYKKEKPTSKIYPRRYSEIRKKPL